MEAGCGHRSFVNLAVGRWGRGNRRGLRAQWPTALAEMVAVGSVKRYCFKTKVESN